MGASTQDLSSKTEQPTPARGALEVGAEVEAAAAAA